MSKKFSIIILLLIISFSALSQNTFSLEGFVRDKIDNTSIIGAAVSIPEVEAGAVTDTNGYFLINNLPERKLSIEVRSVGYSPLFTSAVPGDSNNLNIKLTVQVLENAEVVVTGQSKATEIRRTPMPVLSINQNYLAQHISTNIIDEIARVPGVTAVSTGPNVSKPQIRGLGFNRILTLYDGVRQEGQQWGDEHGIEVDQYNISNVEVVKGPASLTYGSDAVAGVVNMIPTPHAGAGKTLGSVLLEYQGNNGQIGGSAFASGNNGSFYWLGRVSHKQAKNYQNAIDGRVYGTNYNETDITATAGLSKLWGKSEISFTLFDDLQAIPDGSRDSATRKFTKQITEADSFRPIVSSNELNTYTIPDLHQHVQLYRLYNNTDISFGKDQLKMTLAFSGSQRKEYSHPEAKDIPGLDLQLNTYYYDARYIFDRIKGFETLLGVNGYYQTNNVSNGTDFIIPNYRQFNIGPYLLMKKTFAKLDVSGGLRYDVRTFNNNNAYSSINSKTGFDNYSESGGNPGDRLIFNKYNTTFSGISGSAGVAYRVSNRVSFKANVARGFRAPNIYEITADGVHPGTNTFQYGNNTFKPEFNVQEDLGVDFSSTHISANLAVFNNSVQNFIYNEKLGNGRGGDSVLSGVPAFKFQQSNAQLYGGEFSLDIHPHPLDWLHFENGISVVYGQFTSSKNDSGKYLPQIPPLHGFSELRGNFKKAGKRLANAYVKIEVDYYAKQNRVFLLYNTETPTNGYVLLSGALGADVLNKKNKTLFTVTVFGNNLLNTAYQSNLSRLKYFEPYAGDQRGHSGIYDVGRNIGIRVLVPLNFKG